VVGEPGRAATERQVEPCAQRIARVGALVGAAQRCAELHDGARVLQARNRCAQHALGFAQALDRVVDESERSQRDADRPRKASAARVGQLRVGECAGLGRIVDRERQRGAPGAYPGMHAQRCHHRLTRAQLGERGGAVTPREQ
jgi:hypothetical protein